MSLIEEGLELNLVSATFQPSMSAKLSVPGEKGPAWPRLEVLLIFYFFVHLILTSETCF